MRTGCGSRAGWGRVLAVALLLLAAGAVPAAAQGPEVWDGVFLSLTGGGRLGSLDVVEDSGLLGGGAAGVMFSRNGFLELRYTRYDVDERSGEAGSVRGISLGIFVHSADSTSRSAPYVGASFGEVADASCLGLHAGVLDKLGDRWGFRFEAAGRMFWYLGPSFDAQAEAGVWLRL